jgi:ketopantoate reductase
MRERGLRIRSTILGDIDVPRVSVSTRAAGTGQSTSVLVCVKTHQTESILDDLAAAVGDETVSSRCRTAWSPTSSSRRASGVSRVLPTAVYVGATIDEPGVVSHQAPARISIGVRQGIRRTAFDGDSMPSSRLTWPGGADLA